MCGLFIGDSMDRQITYPGQLLAETSLLQATKDAMIGIAKLSAAMLGTSTIANGFAVVPTGPASLQVVCSPGEIYSLTPIDALAFSTLPADTTHSIVKQGILLDGVTLNCPAPGTTGQSINYLIQATYQDTDSTPVLLPYYNSANPALPYSGMGNNGLPQNTARKGSAVVAVKAGASAVTGAQVTPPPDAGYVGLYVVTVAFGQTTITGGSISQYSGAPILPAGLLQSLQSGRTTSAADVGVANAYAANFTPAITALTDGLTLSIKASNTNTTASTFTPAPGVISASPIVGGAHSALQGGEIVANGEVWLQWNTSIGGGSWIVLDNTGGGVQVAPATKSQHAMQLGQATGRLIGVQRFTTSGTYTPTAGTTSVIVEAVGGGGGGAGAGSTAAGQVSIGSGGGAGGYTKTRLTSGFSGAAITIGAGGAQSSAAGNGGSATSFAALLAAGGGVGGAFTAATSTYPFILTGGAGGNASGGNITSQDGGQGSPAIICSTTNQQSGAGGSSFFGAGGVSVSGSNNGINGSGFGSGGSGASSNNGGTAKGSGAGANGVLIVWEYA